MQVNAAQDAGQADCIVFKMANSYIQVEDQISRKPYQSSFVNSVKKHALFPVYRWHLKSRVKYTVMNPLKLEAKSCILYATDTP